MPQQQFKFHHASDGHRGIIFVLLCLFALGFVLSTKGSGATPQGKDDERIYLLHADELYYDAHGDNPDAQIVKGNVKFLHKGGYLTCDSAYFYEQANSVRTMGSVHYWEGDTLSLTCERGFYDGQAQMMEARENVVLVHNKQTLYTDSLNYDRIYQDAYFYDGGKLVDPSQQLVSDWGTYNTATKRAVFYYNVVMVSSNQRVETDTLYYDTNTTLSHVVGPSVVHQDSIVVYTTDGYFDSEENRSRLYGRSTVEKGAKTITGDSLFYDKATGDATGFGNVVYVDSENRNQLFGQYMEYNENTGYGYTTDSALVKDYSQSDDTLFLHGDTIKLFTFNIDTDSAYRLVHCYNNVRAFRTDLQAICDSLVGDSRDSCVTMYQNPVVWNEQRQVLGEVIKVFVNDSTIREVHVIDQALSVEKCDDEDHFNQVSSRLMDTYYIDGKVRQIHAIGNVKAIYYPVDDEDSSLMLLNYTETDTLRIFISEESQLERMWTCKHVSDMYPMTQIPPDKYHLEHFAWFDDLRPKDKFDIFVHKEMKEEDKLKEQDRREAPLQTLPPQEGEEPEDEMLEGEMLENEGEEGPDVETNQTLTTEADSRDDEAGTAVATKTFADDAELRSQENEAASNEEASSDEPTSSDNEQTEADE
ncbi:MAG: hypothetical protein LUI08_06795 [Prevotella sp.]|nr:hypothetical protein [Prevotella sp.]